MKLPVLAAALLLPLTLTACGDYSSSYQAAPRVITCAAAPSVTPTTTPTASTAATPDTTATPLVTPNGGITANPIPYGCNQILGKKTTEESETSYYPDATGNLVYYDDYYTAYHLHVEHAGGTINWVDVNADTYNTVKEGGIYRLP